MILHDTCPGCWMILEGAELSLPHCRSFRHKPPRPNLSNHVGSLACLHGMSPWHVSMPQNASLCHIVQHIATCSFSWRKIPKNRHEGSVRGREPQEATSLVRNFLSRKEASWMLSCAILCAFTQHLDYRAASESTQLLTDGPKINQDKNW